MPDGDGFTDEPGTKAEQKLRARSPILILEDYFNKLLVQRVRGARAIPSTPTQEYGQADVLAVHRYRTYTGYVRKYLPNMSADTVKYRQIYDKIKHDIDDGTYVPGQRLPSETILARLSGFSRITVNRALQELQLEGYITRRAGSGSYVNERRVQSESFGLLIPELGETEIFGPICQGMVDAQQTDGQFALVWGRSIADVKTTPAQAREAVSGLLARKVSGVFFAPLESDAESDDINQIITEMVDKAGLAMVLLDRDVVRYPERSKYDLVGIDNRRAGFIMTQHLIRSGCERVGFLGRLHMAPSCLARAAGYASAVMSQNGGLGAPFSELLDPSDSVGVRDFIERTHPDGLVCSNDRTAAELITTLTALGVKVPDQVKIGAFDDVRYAHLVSVPLTTIRQPCAQLGAAAIRAMIERLKHRGMAARDILVDFQLIVRKSCGGKHRCDGEDALGEELCDSVIEQVLQL